MNNIPEALKDRPTPETDMVAKSDGFKIKCAVTTNGEEPSFEYINVMIIHARHLERERDEAREALMKIKDLFIDGTDIYADREMMGQIARDALEGA